MNFSGVPGAQQQTVSGGDPVYRSIPTGVAIFLEIGLMAEGPGQPLVPHFMKSAVPVVDQHQLIPGRSNQRAVFIDGESKQGGVGGKGENK
ncbi:hypothetical protein GCM10007426_27830 [Alloalcanivorax dieselolei]|nr:hypothetical protein GCM10007426_27830 [Alloalcanivorax dieselolei]